MKISNNKSQESQPTVENTHTENDSILRNPNLLIIFCITLTSIMGISSITPVLPMMSQVFMVSASQIAWLITIFTLPGIILTPVLGMLADLIGRKKVLVPSLLLFSVAGFACTFAQSYEQLLLFRFIQGIGVAALGALNLTMIGDLFSGNRRATAMGYNSAVLSFGATLYPAIGGGLAIFGWYFPFYLPLLALPVALLVLVKLETVVPASLESKTAYLNTLKQNLLNKQVLLLFVATLISFLILYGPILTIIPFFMTDNFTESPLKIGIGLGFVAVGNGLASASMGRLAARFKEQNLLKFSFAAYSVLFLIMPFSVSFEMLVFMLGVFGLCQGINLPVIITLVLTYTTTESRAAVMSVNAMVLQIAQTTAPLIVTFILAASGYLTVYVASAVLALIAGIMVIFKLR